MMNAAVNFPIFSLLLNYSSAHTAQFRHPPCMSLNQLASSEFETTMCLRSGCPHSLHLLSRIRTGVIRNGGEQSPRRNKFVFVLSL
jgi:hypothetical protein